MNFNKDYKEFIEDLKKKNACMASPVLIRVERVAISIFVTYLNSKYAKVCLPTDSADSADVKDSIDENTGQTLQDMCKM